MHIINGKTRHMDLKSKPCLKITQQHFGRCCRESYSPYTIDPPFYLVKMLYILCIRDKIYPTNVINCIVTKTAHRLYTTGRLKSHLLPSDFLLHAPKKRSPSADKLNTDDFHFLLLENIALADLRVKL